MNKINGLKTAVIAVLAAGMLCACANKAQPVNGTTEPLSAPETTTETEIESNTGNIVMNDVLIVEEISQGPLRNFSSLCILVVLQRVV